jgi:hypothetical protein
VSGVMKIRMGAIAALALSAGSFSVARNDGVAHRSYGPAGSSKRNQERSVRRMAQRSRQINRMKK